VLAAERIAASDPFGPPARAERALVGGDEMPVARAKREPFRSLIDPVNLLDLGTIAQ